MFCKILVIISRVVGMCCWSEIMSYHIHTYMWVVPHGHRTFGAKCGVHSWVLTWNSCVFCSGYKNFSIFNRTVILVALSSSHKDMSNTCKQQNMWTFRITTRQQQDPVTIFGHWSHNIENVINTCSLFPFFDSTRDVGWLAYVDFD